VGQYNTEMAKALVQVIILATTVHTGKIYIIFPLILFCVTNWITGHFRFRICSETAWCTRRADFQDARPFRLGRTKQHEGNLTVSSGIAVRDRGF
jgi:hypothetical protein